MVADNVGTIQSSIPAQIYSTVGDVPLFCAGHDYSIPLDCDHEGIPGRRLTVRAARPSALVFGLDAQTQISLPDEFQAGILFQSNSAMTCVSNSSSE